MTWLFLFALQLDAEARARIISALDRLDAFSVHFRQETYSDFLDETRAEGTLSIQRPGKMRMLYSRGERKLLIADGSTYFEHDLLADTEARTPREEYRDEPLIRLLLYGESPEQLFLLDRYRQDDREIFRFRPRDRDDYHIELTLGEDGLPNFLEVISQDGEGTRFFFETFDLNAQFPDDHFTIPPAAEPR